MGKPSYVEVASTVRAVAESAPHIGNVSAQTAIHDVAVTLARTFTATDQAFNARRFLAACGYDTGSFIGEWAIGGAL